MELSKKLLHKWKEMYNHKEPQDDTFSKGTVAIVHFCLLYSISLGRAN